VDRVKAYRFQISGQPAVGDFINVCYRSPRGGRTDASCTAVMGDTPESIAKKIANGATGDKGWIKEAFEVQAKGSVVIVRCSGVVNDIVFSAEIDGKGTLKIETEEI
jgi:hypothetical protein